MLLGSTSEDKQDRNNAELHVVFYIDSVVRSWDRFCISFLDATIIMSINATGQLKKINAFFTSGDEQNRNNAELLVVFEIDSVVTS